MSTSNYNMDTTPNLRIAFWGTSRISVIVLDEMVKEGLITLEKVNVIMYRAQ